MSQLRPAYRGLAFAGCSLVISALNLIGANSALAQAPIPPPVLTAESNENRCGWALGGAAAALGVAAILGPKSGGPSSWTGFYAGGHLGCAWGDTDWTFQNASTFSATGGSTSFSNDGWVGGAQIGYNQQFGQWVLGIEGTWSGGDLQAQKVNALNPNPAVNSTRLTADVDSIVTVVARLGLTFDPRWMGYVKGGFASAEVDAHLFAASAAASTAATASSRHNGWTIGAGLEYLMANNVVLGLDYSYISLEDKTYTPTCGPVACAPNPAVAIGTDIHMLTGRISFLFGAREAPRPLK